jgi:hypothetical protein
MTACNAGVIPPRLFPDCAELDRALLGVRFRKTVLSSRVNTTQRLILFPSDDALAVDNLATNARL